jgi:hypothetical protein
MALTGTVGAASGFGAGDDVGQLVFWGGSELLELFFPQLATPTVATTRPRARSFELLETDLTERTSCGEWMLRCGVRSGCGFVGPDHPD